MPCFLPAADLDAAWQGQADGVGTVKAVFPLARVLNFVGFLAPNQTVPRFGFDRKMEGEQVKVR
jgi:hypothetical protein